MEAGRWSGEKWKAEEATLFRESVQAGVRECAYMLCHTKDRPQMSAGYEKLERSNPDPVRLESAAEFQTAGR